MAVDNITVTGTLGAGVATTSLLFENVVSLLFDIRRQVLSIVYTDGNTDKTVDFDLYLVATVTYSVATHVATVVAST
jgi:hypothetical protein